jgi:hypothetical protein
MAAAIGASANSGTRDTDRVQLTVCHVMPKLLAGTLPEHDAHYRIEPAATAHDFGISREGAKFNLDFGASERLMAGPRHGQLLNRTTAKGWPYLLYVPKAGYVGQDLAIFDVDGKDSEVDQELKFRVKFVLKITAESMEKYLGAPGESLRRRYCPQPVREHVSR